MANRKSDTQSSSSSLCPDVPPGNKSYESSSSLCGVGWFYWNTPPWQNYDENPAGIDLKMDNLNQILEGAMALELFEKLDL